MSTVHIQNTVRTIFVDIAYINFARLNSKIELMIELPTKPHRVRP